MLFPSYEFLFLFLPVVLLVWHRVVRGRGEGAGRTWLLWASLVFYGCGGPGFLGVLIGSMVFNFAWGMWLGRPGGGEVRRWLLGAGVAVNLGLLGYFKYAGFLATNLRSWFGVDWVAPQVVLPLGISFFTFQQIGYLADAYRGLTREYRFRDYALFVTFFPQLIAGPIVHHADLLPQFRSGRTGASGGFAVGLASGLALFTLGLAKKVLVADNLSGTVARVFSAVAAGEDVRCGEAWLGLFAYSFQIYFDFSGYSDMAVGLGRMFGIRLPANFDSPYASRSLAEFWRRWHITLSNFIRDYLYIPLGGNRAGPGRTCFNLVLVMTLAGLWHGANWTFVVWGALHGLFLAIGVLWRRTAGTVLRVPAAVGWAGTFGFVVLAWVLFRSPDLAAAGRYYRELVDLGAAPGGAGAVLVKSRYWIHVLLLVAVVCGCPNSLAWVPGADAGPAARLRWCWRPSAGWGIGLGLLFAVCVLHLARVSEFLYWQF